MPLPDRTLLSLQVHPNVVQSKPKCAMIVRLSAEMLDALHDHPPLSFDFGDVSQGIYIGDTFFPVRPQKESSAHELYLRAASAAKPMAPLKLYANVIGKFMVEPQLGDKVIDKVRQQTMVAKRQHMERQAILLDQPPIPVPAPKNAKRKCPGSGTVVKRTAPSDQPRIATSRKISPLPQSSKANADVRRRLVHCLALSPRLSEEAVKLVGGANISLSARDDLLALLDDVAEQQAPPKKGDKSPRPWALKPPSWTEVRPFEWPKLTEAERITMARQARMALKALKIPESDPAWDNVRYRATAPTIPSSVPPPPPMAATGSNRSSTSTQPELKRSVITTKDTKLKSKQDAPRAKGEIQMKNESSKATASRVNTIKRSEADRQTAPSDSANAAKTVASRRLPGSGYQAKKSPQPSPSVKDKSGTPVDPPQAPKSSVPASLPHKSSTVPPAAATHARKTISAMPPKPVKKEDESDRERDREYDRQRERDREKREKEKEKRREERERERERVEVEKREKAKQNDRETMEREKHLREKEREREEIEHDKRQRVKERTSKERVVSGAVPAFKRKPAMPETHEDASSKPSLPKRRKLDDGAFVASSSSKVRDAEAPKKVAREPSPVPRLKMKNDPSSPQASVSSQDRRATSASGSTHKSERSAKASSSAKPRRRSPVYTSSEDEGEIPQPRKRNPSPPPISDRSNSSDQPQSEKALRHHRTTRGAYPPATDHAALRTLYQSQYATYLGTFSKVVAQKRKIEAMLKGDSEAEMDMMEPDDLIKLSMEHKALRTELEHIHDIYIGGKLGAVAIGGSGSPSD